MPVPLSFPSYHTLGPLSGFNFSLHMITFRFLFRLSELFLISRAVEGPGKGMDA